MRRSILLILALPMLLAAFIMAASPAFAASPHFKKGGEPACTFSGTTSIPVTCTGTLAGLGNEDLNWKARLRPTRRSRPAQSRTGT